MLLRNHPRFTHTLPILCCNAFGSFQRVGLSATNRQGLISLKAYPSTWWTRLKNCASAVACSCISKTPWISAHKSVFHALVESHLDLFAFPHARKTRARSRFACANKLAIIFACVSRANCIWPNAKLEETETLRVGSKTRPLNRSRAHRDTGCLAEIRWRTLMPMASYAFQNRDGANENECY